MFTKYLITPKYTIEQLSKVRFEDIAKGRKGAVLVDCKDDTIPIVRTTTVYNSPAQRFSEIHYDLVNDIKKVVEQRGDAKNIEFNNALIEIYDNTYYKMGYHTDQALDLEQDSWICLFSCYEKPTVNIRTLVVKNKRTAESSQISLDHNSFVLFSTADNQEHLHKIVLRDPVNVENKWLGITFRLSKTFVHFNNSVPYINATALKIANDNEKREFLIHKGKENSSIGYVYPEIGYTNSPSEMLPISNE